MGVPPNYLLDLKGLIPENNGNSNTSTTTTTSNPSSDDGFLCSTARENLWQTRRKPKYLRKNKRALMKRRRSTFRRDENGIERKVQILQRLIPNTNSEPSQGLDGLFRDAASYIISLQMRVRFMQFMVNALESPQDYE